MFFFLVYFPMIVNDDGDSPKLSAETLKALQEWQQEQEQNNAANVPQEDWVSQFYFLISIMEIAENSAPGFLYTSKLSVR
jgi:hypothetical protein